MIEIAHEYIGNEDTLARICIEMIEYAKKNPFEYKKVLANAQADPELKVEHHNPLVRVSGQKEQEQIKPYNRHITFDGKTGYQITFLYNVEPNVNVAQLTVINSHKEPVNEHVAELFTMIFMDPNYTTNIIPTPPHVYVVAQAIARPEMN